MTPGKATSTSSALRSPSRFLSRPAVAEAAALGAVLVGAGLVYARSLDNAANFDEGVYLASLDALRHGQQLGSDVFPDQPPGFYLLLRIAAAVFGNSVHGVRVGMLLLALVGLVGAWGVGRALGGAVAGVAAAAVLAVAPPWPTFAPLVEADTPAVALALVSLALVAWGARGRPWLAAAGGAVFVVAVSTKFLAAAAAVGIAGLLVQGRASRRAVLACCAGAVATAGAFLAAYARQLPEIWNGNVTVHRYARSLGAGYGANLRRVLELPDPRTPFAWLLLLGALLAVGAVLRGRALALWPLWLFAAASAAFLVWEQPLLDHHLVLLAAALAPPAAIAIAVEGRALSAGRLRAAAAAGVVALVAAGAVQEEHRLARDAVPEPADVAWAVSRVRGDVPTSGRVATDLPIVAYLAHRRIPGELIDTSAGRLGSGYLTDADVVRDIDRDGVRAVVVARLFEGYPRILRGVATRFRCRAVHGSVTVYERCRRAP